MVSLKEPTRAEDYLCLNLDFRDITKPPAQAMLKLSQEFGIMAKVGTELTSHNSWLQILSTVNHHRLEVFADTKANDISNTVEATLATIFRLHPEMVNIHASSSEAALARFLTTRQRLQSHALQKGAGSLAIGVAMLTDKTDEEIREEFNGRSRKQQTRWYADKLTSFGFDGLTCAGVDLKMLNRSRNTRDMVKVVLGVRPEWALANDQRFPITPAEAIRLGGRVLGIGRPITNPPPEIGSPRNAVEKILEEIDQALPSAA